MQEVLKNLSFDVDAFCGQEHKRYEHEILECRQKLLKWGWISVWSPAVMTDKGARSGGVMIAVREHVGIAEVPIEWVHDEVQQHRAVMAQANFPGIGCMLLSSVYLEVGKGMNSGNQGILASLAATAQLHLMPSFWAGDFNNPPVALEASGIPQQAEMAMVCTGRHTCFMPGGSSEIDFALISKCRHDLVHEVLVEDSVIAPPHRAVVVRLRHTSALRPQQELVQPCKLPFRRLRGPLPERPPLLDQLWRRKLRQELHVWLIALTLAPFMRCSTSWITYGVGT